MAGPRRTTVGIAAVTLAAAAAALGQAAVPAAPTVAECARLQLKSPALKGSRLAATVFCLRPASIRTTASVRWTTCPTTPIEEPCAEGLITVSFRSTGSTDDMDSWGGENVPGAGLFALTGTGTYRCKASDIDRQVGRTVIRSYTRTLPLRDVAVGFAAVGRSIRVATSVHPGFRGRLGQNANVRLGQPETCQLSGLPVGPDAVRVIWPGANVSPTAIRGDSTRVATSGNFTRSIPATLGDASPGVKIEGTVKWSSAVVVVSALKRN